MEWSTAAIWMRWHNWFKECQSWVPQLPVPFHSLSKRERMMFFLTFLLLTTPVVLGQSSISIYVSSARSNSSIPCGTSYGSPCPWPTAGFKSIPILSNSSFDNVTIFLFPGTHNACDVSYFSLIYNASRTASTFFFFQTNQLRL
jgi:hypothetical protein